jgi:hypothetical protein
LESADWLASFADLMSAHAATDRLSDAHEVDVDGQSYRKRLEPEVGSAPVPSPGSQPTMRCRERRKLRLAFASPAEAAHVRLADWTALEVTRTLIWLRSRETAPNGVVSKNRVHAF